MSGIIIRIIKQTVNDRRSLALILFAPLLMLTLIFFLLGKPSYTPRISVNSMPDKIVQELQQKDMVVETVNTVDEGKEAVKDKKTDAFIYKENDQINMLFESSDTVKNGVILNDIQTAMQKLSTSSAISVKYIYGNNDESMFNSLSYVLLGVLSFFFVFIIAGISFVREHSTQTMERLMLSPIKRWQVIMGYTLGFGFFAVLQSIIMIVYAILVLGITIVGSIYLVIIIMFLLSITAVVMGAFVSIFSNNEFQIMQFIPVVVVPQIFFSGLISLDTIPYNIGIIAKVMPVYYACDALKEVTIKGSTFMDIWVDIAILILFIAGFSFMNIIALKKYRKL
jgi:ABC-2 type transport system permease protein